MSGWTDFRNTLERLGLPLLGAALPVPGAAAIVGALAQMLTTDPANPHPAEPDAIVNTLQQSQTAREIASRFQATNALELSKLAHADTLDARQREAMIAAAPSAPTLSKLIVPILALLVVIGFGAVMVMSPQADVRMAANSMIMLVLGYYFGTSSGSQKNQEAMRAATVLSQDATK